MSQRATFYFAEGTCRPNFDPYFTIQNPGNTTANVTLTYMKGDGTTASATVNIPKSSRATVSPRATLGTGDDIAHDFSTKVECTNGQQIIAERPMYFNYGGAWNGGSDVVGTTSPQQTWYFAEGTCRPGFDTYFTIQNPGNITADVRLNYMKGDGTSATDSVDVPGKSRATVFALDTLGTGDDAAHDFSTQVTCTNGQQIIAERPIYFNYHGIWTGGSDVVGAGSPELTWYFAEGTCRPEFDPYFTIQNPRGTTANVTLTYMKGDSTTASATVAVPGNSRATVSPVSTLGTGDDAAHDFSTRITSNQPIIAERPMYFDYKNVWTGGDDVMGATSPYTAFYFSEGTCRPNFDPYLTIQNPGNTTAFVKLTYMKGDGTTTFDEVDIPENSRATVLPRNKLGTGNNAAHDFSTLVTSINARPVIVERPMYFDYNGAWTGGHDVVGCTP